MYRWTASCCHYTHSQEMLDGCPCLLGTVHVCLAPCSCDPQGSLGDVSCYFIWYNTWYYIALLCVARCRHDWGLRTDQSTWLVKLSILNHNTRYYIALTFWSGSTICTRTLHRASALSSGSPQLHLWWLLQTMSHALIGLGPRPASQLGVHAIYSFHKLILSAARCSSHTQLLCTYMCLGGGGGGG